MVNTEELLKNGIILMLSRMRFRIIIESVIKYQ